MKVEKRSSNKIGLIILLIVVLAGSGFGGYFLYKHKDKLNIDWNIELPWQKKEEKVAGSDNDLKRKTIPQNQDITFEGPSSLSSKRFFNMKECDGEFKDFNETDTEFIVEVEIKGSTGETPHYCYVEISQYAADSYTIPGSTKVEVQPGETEIAEIKLNKSDLEAQELSGIQSLSVYLFVKDTPDGELIQYKEEAKFSNERSIKNDKIGISVDVLNSTNIKYYKTTTDASNTYIYFILENNSTSYLADVKIRKLIVNDKVFDTKDFDEQIGLESKKVVYIVIPKKTFTKVKKFTISFFNISTDIKTEEQSYYISNEYSREV